MGKSQLKANIIYQNCKYKDKDKWERQKQLQRQSSKFGKRTWERVTVRWQ